MLTLPVLQDVQQCIQEQRASMKEVLEDTRLVTLQREGGAVLARMRREEFRFPQSEDYRYQMMISTHVLPIVHTERHIHIVTALLKFYGTFYSSTFSSHFTNEQLCTPTQVFSIILADKSFAPNVTRFYAMY